MKWQSFAEYKPTTCLKIFSQIYYLMVWYRLLGLCLVWTRDTRFWPPTWSTIWLYITEYRNRFQFSSASTLVYHIVCKAVMWSLNRIKNSRSLSVNTFYTPFFLFIPWCQQSGNRGLDLSNFIKKKSKLSNSSEDSSSLSRRKRKIEKYRKVFVRIFNISDL